MNNNIRELKTDSTLWATPAKLVNLLKLIKTITHQVRYENGLFND